MRTFVCGHTSAGHMLSSLYHTCILAKRHNIRTQFPDFLILSPLPIFWDLLHFSSFVSLQRGRFSSQGLVGSASDTNWDSLVPQAASIEGRGEGTCAALVGFLLGA